MNDESAVKLAVYLAASSVTAICDVTLSVPESDRQRRTASGVLLVRCVVSGGYRRRVVDIQQETESPSAARYPCFAARLHSVNACLDSNEVVQPIAHWRNGDVAAGWTDASSPRSL